MQCPAHLIALEDDCQPVAAALGAGAEMRQLHPPVVIVEVVEAIRHEDLNQRCLNLISDALSDQEHLGRQVITRREFGDEYTICFWHGVLLSEPTSILPTSILILSINYCLVNI